MIQEEITFWAKTLPGGQPALSLRDHCLNVGFVAQSLLALLPACIARMLPPGTITLAALHDVGKASPGFQRKCMVWRLRFEPKELEGAWGQREKKHAKVSLAILGQWLDKSHGGYAIAAGGHHGTFADYRLSPPLGEGGHFTSAELNDPFFVPGRTELRALMAEAFGADLPCEPLAKKSEARIVFLTGFMTFADWLGSNEAFFPLDAAAFEHPLSLAEATDLARNRARAELDWLGWGRTDVRRSLSFEEIFPSYQPNAVQSELASLAEKPGLFIVEAPMGSGKTEAALAAAYRRWNGKDGQRGLYFALPTQLTSNRIFERLSGFLAHALSGSDLATLVHGSAWLRQDRVLEIHPSEPSEQEEGTASDARLWFAPSRQALLAPFGAGTIDQALLGVLPAKHCGLRLFGLAGKVVIIDEVHSYDPYTGKLVDKLVSDLLELNATVIVLSATLTAARKQALLSCAGIPEEALPAMFAEDPYPLITSATRETAEHVWSAAVTPIPWEAPSVKVRLEHRHQGDPGILEEACDAARQGACVLIIRNTVALAQETWRQLMATRCEGDPAVALLHSRFPRWRRDELEAQWIAALGKTGPRPNGCLLVATQVVEQSVDIDADLLITDLAPTDLLFQRFGRLHRHKLKRPQGFETPRAVILHPPLDGETDKRGLKMALGPSGFVYPPYVLWRAYQQWREQTHVTLPRDIRPWLEASYVPLETWPFAGVEALYSEWMRRAEELEATALTRANRLRTHEQADTEGFFTRWNDQRPADVLTLAEKPEVLPGGQGWKLRLLDGQTITLPAFGWSFDAAKALHRNLIRMPRYAVRSWEPANPPWAGEYLESAVVGVLTGGTVQPLSEVMMPYLLAWNPDEGLRVTKNEQTSPPPDEPDEDGWW